MKLFRKTTLIFLLSMVLTACSGDEEAQPVAAAVISTVMPTPTLAAGLPTVPVLPTEPPLNTAVAAPESTQPLPTLTAVPTVTPLPTATAMPMPQERIQLANADLHNGNDAQAIRLLEANVQQPDAFTPAQQIHNVYSLGIAYGREGRHEDALRAFDQLTALAGEQMPTAAHFYIGQTRAALGDHAGAIAAYQAYLDTNADMGAYVYPLIAEAYTAMGDIPNAQTARETAVTAPAHRLTEIANRQLLAQLYLNAQNYAAAITHYDAIRSLAVTEFTQGEMAYKAGYAELLAGNNEAAYSRFQQALTAYPRAYETYLGLVELVEAGVPVDEYQRGLVNYYAKSYDRAAAAFEHYLQANPESANPEAHLYAAWSYEALGNLPAALAALDGYAAATPAMATIERGKMLARTGDRQGALENYQAYLQNYPDGQSAPFAAWWSAAIAERQGDVPTAVTRYTLLADNYGWHEDAPQALFHAGWLAYHSGDSDIPGSSDTAVILWQRAAQNYPASQYGSAALVWLLRVLPSYASSTHEASGAGVPDPHKMLAFAQRQAEASQTVNYYALRAKDLVMANGAFTAVAPFQHPTSEEEAAAQIEAEAWLRDWLGFEAEADVRTLAPSIAADARFIRGQKLWQLGLREQAKRELEAVREAYAGDALSSYQLALAFRELGLYRSSILAAARLPILAGQSVLTVPKFIGRLMYPVYYADLVLPLADNYGYDPRLQFALLRQESLFESFATSSAVAQGLSQVIPDTGAYIARQLNWPDYENDDLYKPYVGLNFGAFYLDQQLDTFNGSVHAALSAYNAGPGNAARWYDQAGNDLDVYVETVDFTETRTYIERIYEGFAIYRYLYGN